MLATWGAGFPFSPSSLFSAGETGAWYDPSDYTTLFEDSAGTIPITSPLEKPVGKMLDKSGRGNHATQATTTSRPTLSARYNLLTKTEQFDDAAWSKQSGSGASAPVVTANYGIAPDGTQTADRVQLAITTGYSQVTQTVSAYQTGATYIYSVWIKSLSGTPTVDLGYLGTGFGAYKPTLTTEWAKYSFTFVAGASMIPGIMLYGATGTSTSADVLIWGADLRVANDGVGLPSYQRVNTATDFAVDGFPAAEVFDGTDDSQITAAGGGSTTAFFWCSSIRVGKVGAVQTLFSDTGTNTGYRVRINASNQLELAAGNNTTYITATTTDTLTFGQRAVLTAWHDGTNLNVQINNGTVVQAAFATATAGTAQITIGKDNNAASSYFMGRLYEKVYLKDTVLSAASIASTKSFCAQKAKVTL